MKKLIKRFTLIWVLLSLSATAMSQYSSVMSEDPNLPKGGVTIVRNMSPTEVVTYVRNNTNHYFTYENNSSTTYNFCSLNPIFFDKINIRDFRIINGILYFCGVDNDNQKGVLGTFKATDLLNPPPSSLQIDFLNVDNTTELNRINVYKDPGTGDPRVAAVGYNNNNPCGANAQSVWVDCEGFMPTTPPTSILVFDSYCSGSGDFEQWFDVVSTDVWVVLVGYGKIGGTEGLALRKFHKGNPTDPNINDIYIYNETGNIDWTQTRAEFIRRNDMAVVYRGESSQNVSDFNRFRIFDIDLMKNTNSQEYTIPYKSYLWEMAFMPRAERVVVLSDFLSPTFTSNFVYITPYQNTSYTSVYVNYSDWRFQSITNLDRRFFVGAGPFHFLLREASASYPAPNVFSPVPVLCPADQSLKVSRISDIPTFRSLERLPGPTPSSRRMDSPTAATGQNGLSIKCYSY